MDVPKFLHHSFRTSLLADPTCVDLASRCPYFYELGTKIASLYETRYICFLFRRMSWSESCLNVDCCVYVDAAPPTMETISLAHCGVR